VPALPGGSAAPPAALRRRGVALLDPGSPAGSFNKAGGAGPVTQAYGVALYPTFYIIDPVGRVKWRGDREQPDALLLQKLIDATGA
jgi:hypothetical protein